MLTFRDKYYRYGYLALLNKNDGEWVRKALVEEYDCKVLEKKKLFKRTMRSLSMPIYMEQFIQDEIAFKGPNAIVVGQAMKDLCERLGGRRYTYDPHGYIGD